MIVSFFVRKAVRNIPRGGLLKELCFFIIDAKKYETNEETKWKI